MKGKKREIARDWFGGRGLPEMVSQHSVCCRRKCKSLALRRLANGTVNLSPLKCPLRSRFVQRSCARITAVLRRPRRSTALWISRASYDTLGRDLSLRSPDVLAAGRTQMSFSCASYDTLGKSSLAAFGGIGCPSSPHSSLAPLVE